MTKPCRNSCGYFCSTYATKCCATCTCTSHSWLFEVEAVNHVALVMMEAIFSLVLSSAFPPIKKLQVSPPICAAQTLYKRNQKKTLENSSHSKEGTL